MRVHFAVADGVSSICRLQRWTYGLRTAEPGDVTCLICIKKMRKISVLKYDTEIPEFAREFNF